MSFMESRSSALILYSAWMMISSISKFLLRIEYKIKTSLPYLPSLLSQVSFDDWIGPVLKKNRTTAPPSLRTVFKNEFRAKNVPIWPKMAPKGPKTATAKSEFFATWAEFQWRMFQKSFSSKLSGHFGLFWAILVSFWGNVCCLGHSGQVKNVTDWSCAQSKQPQEEQNWMEMISEVILKSFTRFWAILGPFRGQSRPFKAKNSKLLHTSHVTTKTATRGAEFRWIWFSMSLLRSSGHLGAIFGPKMAHNDLYVSRVMSKAFPLEFCTSCGRFEWSHD